MIHEPPREIKQIDEATHMELILAATVWHRSTSTCASAAYLPSSSSIIPRLVEDMVSVSANTLALEDSREAQVLGYLVFRDDVVGALGLTNDELTDL